MLCRNCLTEIFENMDKDDKTLLIALDEKKTLNKEGSSQVTKLTTSKLRDAISRTKGATLIEEAKIGNNILLRLSKSGVEMVKVIKGLSNKQV